MTKMQIFVTVGTNHNNFVRMLNLVDECLKLIKEPYVLNVQYGSSTPYALKPGQSGQSQSMYSRQETQKLVENADLVFSHCGIGSIHNALQYNRPTVIIPRLHKFDEFSDDHQLQIAKEIRQNPLLYMIDETFDETDFSLFLEKMVPQVKEKIDLTNHHLADFMRSRLLGPSSSTTERS